MQCLQRFLRYYYWGFIHLLFGGIGIRYSFAWTVVSKPRDRVSSQSLAALSDAYLEGDLVAVKRQSPNGDEDDDKNRPRLCVVVSDGGVVPLCTRLDDVETDLFADPRQYADNFWTQGVTDDNVVQTYGEGYYGQRPVPSLGGGPGYGATADEVWSTDLETIEAVAKDGVELPVLDVGIAHGEKARGGSF
jgi:hypothetical protein